MRFVSVRDLREKAAEIWRELPGDKEIVLTSHGKPIAILTSVTEDTLEQALTAIRKAMAVEAVAAMQLQSAKTGRNKITQAQINREISAARTRKSFL